MVERTVVPDTPVRVEYSLTKKGRALATAIDSISDWAEKHVSLEPSARPARKAKA
ncbi:MAG: winged helix-turn-helix transcriptional regulator [Acidimicrobiia bacterium]